MFSHHRYASRVVESFFVFGNNEDRSYILDRMFVLRDGQLSEASWALDMMLDPFANYIIQRILEVVSVPARTSQTPCLSQVCDREQQKLFCDVIRENIQKMSNSHGKSVVDAAINMGLMSASEIFSRRSSYDGLRG